MAPDASGKSSAYSTCRKHGVPYVKESVFTRPKKTVDVMIGRASMKRAAVG